VGLVSGACLADFGHQVICVDKQQDKIAALQRGEIPIFEPGLAELVSENTKSNRLLFTTDLAAAVAEAELVFVAVGTPPRPDDGRADLSAVHTVASEIAMSLRNFVVIATKSTVPVGTGDEIERIIRGRNPLADVAVVSNPEFLREGAAIGDFKLPNRIIVGLEDERARPVMTEAYRPLYINQAPLVFTRRRTAELIKYAANAFLAMKISFINEIADLCELVGTDVQDVARGIGLDNRIGPKFLHAGPGFGGSCFPKDTKALAQFANDQGISLRLVDATIAINEQRKREIARKIISACGGDVRGKRIALLGLAFKPNTNDMREAPAIAIIQSLQDAGALVKAYDPASMGVAQQVLQGVEYGTDAYDTAIGAEALVIVTEWSEFRALDFDRLKAAMATHVLVDLRNIYSARDGARHGFQYVGVGQSPLLEEINAADPAQ
jgi:UDPglucose 6-dehydrogenase